MPISNVFGLPRPVLTLGSCAGFTFCYRTKALGELRIPYRGDGKYGSVQTRCPPRSYSCTFPVRCEWCVVQRLGNVARE
jgi:hypothetical protein